MRERKKEKLVKTTLRIAAPMCSIAAYALLYSVSWKIMVAAIMLSMGEVFVNVAREIR